LSVVSAFSASYSEARAKFLDAVAATGGAAETFVNPKAKGPEGEVLACDVVRFGAADARRVLWLNSATHGAEGYCGSGAQIALLADGLHKRLPADTALVISHALNPYGFAWTRRVTEDNVDLNRNFFDHDRPHPKSDAYNAIHHLLIPADWDGPAREAAEAGIRDYIARNGAKAYQAAVTGGQYDQPTGVFYGGRAPCWSNIQIRDLARRHGAGAAEIIFLDFHTGLGPNGYGELIYGLTRDQSLVPWAQGLFGNEVTNPGDGSSTSAPVQGTVVDGVAEEVPHARMLGIAIEYGTEPVPEVLDSLRGDHWLHVHGGRETEQGRAIVARVRRAFYSETDEWKEKIVARAQDVVGRALAGWSA
jgi:hypothetical protein